MVANSGTPRVSRGQPALLVRSMQSSWFSPNGESVGCRPADGQELELIEKGGDRRIRIAGRLHVREALQRLFEEDLELEPGKRGAQAEVAAAGAEGLVLRVAVDVEAVGILVDVLVAVRADVPHQHLVALVHGATRDLGVAGGGPAEVGEGRVHPQ